MIGGLFKKFSNNLFFKACKHGDYDQVKTMLETNSNLATMTDSNGCSGLIYAATNGHNKIVSLILSISTEAINTLEPFKEGSPLLYAATKGNIATVRVLLENGANSNLEDTNGVTPLHLAIEQEYLEIVGMLCSHGASLLARDKNGNTPLDLMARSDNPELRSIFLEFTREMGTEKSESEGGKPRTLF